VAALCLTPRASAQQPTLQDPLLDKMTGCWVLSGSIMGKQTTHDVDAAWVANHQFVRMHEISREKTATGLPAYEAYAFLGWDTQRDEYVVHWMDIFGGGFSSVGYGKKTAATIPLVFKSPNGDFHTTFALDSGTNKWNWAMDSDLAGKLQPFARLTMVKASSGTCNK
jgi:hypothetical protein